MAVESPENYLPWLTSPSLLLQRMQTGLTANLSLSLFPNDYTTVQYATRLLSYYLHISTILTLVRLFPLDTYQLEEDMVRNAFPKKQKRVSSPAVRQTQVFSERHGVKASKY